VQAALKIKSNWRVNYGNYICRNSGSIKKGKPMRGWDWGCTKWTKWRNLK